mgnify:FL=1
MRTNWITVMLLILCLCLMPALVRAEIISSGFCGAQGENLTWTLDENGLLMISGEGAMQDFAWDDSPFFFNTSIESVVITEGVTHIGQFAFLSCYSISSVSLPESLESIAGSAFTQCFAMHEVALPDHLQSLGDGAFATCGLSGSMFIPASVSEIGYGAFLETALEAIEVDPDNPNYVSVDGVLFTKDMKTLLQYPERRPGSIYEVPDGTEQFSSISFFSCTELESVFLPASLREIDEDQCFQFCDALQEITVDAENLNYASLDGVLFTKDVKKLIRYPDNREAVTYAIPDGVETIGPFAFFHSLHVTKIDIPEGVEGIGWCAFGECQNLHKVVFAASVRTISSVAFSECTDLTIYGRSDSYVQSFALSQNIPFRALDRDIQWSLVLPDDLTEIEKEAFAGDSSVTSVKLGEAVRSIGSGAFAMCTMLEDVWIPKGVTSIAQDAFDPDQPLIFYGTYGSAAQAYADAQGFVFVVSDEEMDKQT